MIMMMKMYDRVRAIRGGIDIHGIVIFTGVDLDRTSAIIVINKGWLRWLSENQEREREREKIDDVSNDKGSR